MAMIRADVLILALVESSLLGPGSRLVIAWKARGFTQANLAQLAGVGRGTISLLEAKYHGVSVGNLLKVLMGLDVLGQVGEWLTPARDRAVLAFATRLLSKKFETPVQMQEARRGR